MFGYELEKKSKIKYKKERKIHDLVKEFVTL